MFLYEHFHQGETTNGNGAAGVVQHNRIPQRARTGDSAAGWLAAQPPQGPRSREHLHPSGSRGRVFASGDALFHRKRLLCNVAPGAESVLPRKDSVPAPPRGYKLQVSRDDRIPRRVPEADWRGASCPQEPGSARRRRQSICAGHAKMLRLAENKIAAGCACGRRIQRRIWRSASR